MKGLTQTGLAAKFAPSVASAVGESTYMLPSVGSRGPGSPWDKATTSVLPYFAVRADAGPRTRSATAAAARTVPRVRAVEGTARIYAANRRVTRAIETTGLEPALDTRSRP